MVEDNTTTEGTSDESTSDGSDANGSTTEETTEVTDTTTVQNITENDPEKNKKLSEITIGESLRDLMTFNITLPGSYKGMHTNQFLWMDLKDDFYDDFYGEIMDLVGENKLNRYTGFEKNRFYIQKKVWSYTMEEGITTELELNPLPSAYSDYMKYQLQAENSLDQAVIDLMKGGRETPTTSTATGNYDGEDCDPSNGLESNKWAGHRCKPPVCTDVSKEIHGNSDRAYARDTASHNTSSRDLVNFVASRCTYSRYPDNPYGEKRCPENMWTSYNSEGTIYGNCADFSRMLKCILDVNGYNSMICHIPNHFYNAIWENNNWTVCDICSKTCSDQGPVEAYGHANHGNTKPSNTWDTPKSTS